MIEAPITIQKRAAFSVVPDAVLENLGLSFSARVALAWLLGRPTGWQVRVGHLCRVLGLTGRTWPRSRKELEAAGFFRQERRRGAGNQFVWVHVVTDAPLYVAQASIPTNREDGSIPTVCRDAARIDAPRADIAAQRGTEQKAAAARRLPADGKRRRERPSGIVTWSTDDAAEAQRIEEAFDVAAIAEAVASVGRAGKDAVPGLVAREIKRLRRNHDAERPILEGNRRRQEQAAIVDTGATARGLSLLPPTLRAHVAARRPVNET